MTYRRIWLVYSMIVMGGLNTFDYGYDFTTQFVDVVHGLLIALRGMV